MNDTENIKSKRRKRGRISLFIKAAIIAVVFFLLVTAINSSFFHIKVVEIYGGDRVSRQDVVNTGITEGVNIFTVSIKRCKAELLTNPYVKTVHIAKTYPDKITITIEERTPRAYILAGSAGQYLLVDETGTVISIGPYQPELGLPIAAGLSFESYGIGETLDIRPIGALEAVMEVASILTKYGVIADKIDVSNIRDLRIHAGLCEYAIGGMEDADAKIAMCVRMQEESPDFRGLITYKDAGSDRGFFTIIN